LCVYIYICMCIDIPVCVYVYMCVLVHVFPLFIFLHPLPTTHVPLPTLTGHPQLPRTAHISLLQADWAPGPSGMHVYIYVCINETILYKVHKHRYITLPTTLYTSPLFTSHNLPPHYTTLFRNIPHHTTLHYTTLHHTTLHYTTLHYTTLHYAIPRSSE
jgi:hypothetical protein